MNWDPDRYERFSHHRLRPGLDLLERVRDIDPRFVVDLGCGTGTLTAIVAGRWPNAQVKGLDSSQQMLERAPTTMPNLTWERGDIASWRADRPVGLIFSNAALHWLDDHAGLFGGLVTSLETGGVLAVQMPDNWTQPTHRIPAAVLDEGDYPDEAHRALLRNPVARAEDYRRWLGPDVDCATWSTTYHQTLTGEHPVLEWVRGSVLAPVIAALDDPEPFLAECARRYRSAYPPQPDGTTVLPFRRLFIVARRR